MVVVVVCFPSSQCNQVALSPFVLAVQHERGPRNSTIRRQMALLLKESSDLITAYHHHQHYRPHPLPANFHHPLDLRRPMIEATGPISAPPVLPPPTVDTQESAARILFNAINWTKTVPAFVSLSTHDQVNRRTTFSLHRLIVVRSQLSLLEEAWRDLFLLTAAEQQLIIDERTSAVKQSDITAMRTLLQTCQQLEIDANEYICLKSLVLFRTCRNAASERDDFSSIAYLQDQAKILLNTYINKQYPSQPHRFSKLIQLLSNFRAISSLTIEDLFFRQTIGEQTHMEQLVKDMYQINMAAMVAQASI